jgi:hypothetical protein
MKFGKLAQSFGATGADERGFAVFPSKTHGEAAMAGLLSQNYRGMNLGQIARKYEGTGNWPAWAARVSKETGLGINDTPNFDDPEKMKAFQRGVAGAEGTRLAPSAPAAKADAADRQPWPRTLDKTPLAGGPEPDSWSDIGKGAQGDDALDRHRQMREEMERPIKMNIEAPTMPSQLVPSFRRASARDVMNREMRDERWSSFSDIGAA